MVNLSNELVSQLPTHRLNDILTTNNMEFFQKKMALSLTLGALAIQVSAQPGGRFAQVKSPVVNADNTVTFNYQNENAKEVLVDVQFAGRHAMAKGENGIWSVTLGPAAPDM